MVTLHLKLFITSALGCNLPCLLFCNPLGAPSYCRHPKSKKTTHWDQSQSSFHLTMTIKQWPRECSSSQEDHRCYLLLFKNCDYKTIYSPFSSCFRIFFIHFLLLSSSVTWVAQFFPKVAQNVATTSLLKYWHFKKLPKSHQLVWDNFVTKICSQNLFKIAPIWSHCLPPHRPSLFNLF